MTRRIWFERKFVLGLPPEAHPDIVERLRGTPVRLEELLTGIEPEICRAKPDERWTILEHVGHLIDLEHLWIGRTKDLVEEKEVLLEADLTNRRTEEAGHNVRELRDLLAEFRKIRMPWVHELEEWAKGERGRTALHPRLRQPMSIVDLAFFVAEHDDHHIATIRSIQRRG